MASGEKQFSSLIWENSLEASLRPPKFPFVEENAAFRNRLFDMADQDQSLRVELKQLCAVSPYFLVMAFGNTYDPRRNPAILPFVLYPIQVQLLYELLSAIFIGYDYFIEKCRDMGASWTVVVAFVYCWLYWPNSAFLLGSFKEERVDKKRGSLMKMAETFIRLLPPWLLPKEFEMSKHRTFLSMLNPGNNSSIEGEATNDQFGRADRKTAVLFDELAFWGEKAAGMDSEAWEGVADVTNCRIALSTYYGVNNEYHRQSVKFKSGKLRGMTLAWTDHPIKAEGLYTKPDGMLSSPWLDIQETRRTKSYLAREIHMDPGGTGSPAFPHSMRTLQSRIAVLTQRIMDGEYGKAFEFVFDAYAEDRTKLAIGTRIKGIQDWRMPSPDLLAEMFTDQRNHTGTPGVLWIFEEPEPDWQYLYGVAADQSEGLGKGGDFHYITVLRQPTTHGEKIRQVAAWRGQVDQDILAEIFVWLSRRYGNATFIPEASAVGQTMISYSRDIVGPGFSANCIHSQSVGKDQETLTDRIGIVNSRVTKPPMIALMAAALRNDEIELNCLQAVLEMFNYENSGKNTYKGKSPFHDDAAMGVILGLAGLRTGQMRAPFRYTDEMRKAAEKAARKRREDPCYYDGVCV